MKRAPRRGCAAEHAPRRTFCCGRVWPALAAALVACTPSAPKGVVPLPLVATPVSPAPDGARDSAGADLLALDAALVERVPEGSFGPYLGAGADGHAAAVWAALTEGEGWRWFSTVLDEKGVPLGKPQKLAEAPSELSLATVTASARGFVVLASAVTPTGTRVEALELGPAGELARGPLPLVHSRTEVLWLRVLSAGGVNVALWASLGVGSADLLLAPLAAAGAQQAAPERVLEGAKAWQAIEFSDGIALAAVSVGSSDEERDLGVSFLDTEGRSLGRAVLRSDASLLDHVDAARVGDNLVVVWAERDGVDARLYSAAIAPDMHVLAPPEPAMAPFGRQRPIALLPDADARGALLAFEHVGQAPRGEQRVQIARVNERGQVERPAAELSFAGTSPEELELARKGGGLGVLTRAVVCARDVTPCATPEAVPAYVELDDQLEVFASEPVRLTPEAGKPVDLAWGLHCTAEVCSALGALPSAPVPIYGIELRARSRGWLPIASHISDALPRATELRALGDTDPLADVAVAPMGSGLLLATLTQFDDATPYVRPKTPAPDGKLAPVRALLAVRPVTSEGRAQATKVVSYRARASSGIALARLEDERALLAWTALDRGQPEVFATLLGKAGQSVEQRMLTTGAGEVTALGAAPLGKGSVVAWIGKRDGEPRLYAARLNEELERTAPEQRLSSAAGFTGLSLARRGDEAWVASTRREDREEVLALTRLDPRTAARRGDELSIQRSDTSTLSSPVLVARGAGALLGWVERPLIGGGPAGRVWLVELDAQGQRVGEPQAIAPLAGEPAALRLHCEAAQCQGVIDARPADGAAIEGFVWPAPNATRARALEARTLVRRASVSSDAPALALGDGTLFYADRLDRRGLLRRLAVTWR